MTTKPPRSAPTPSQGHPSAPPQAKPKTQPAEPAEVLGRHKNTGQKDHKGAR